MTRPTANKKDESVYSLPWPQADSLRAHPFVWSVAVLCCVPYAILMTQNLAALSGWFVPADASALWQSPWRILTPTFVHYTLAHLLTNLYVWWYFGAKIESASRNELVVIFFVTAIVSNSAQWLVSGPLFGGLSGVTYGLLSYCWGLKYFKKNTALLLDKGLSILLLILLPVAASGVFGKFSNTAHFIGLACGFILAGSNVLYSHLNQRSPDV